MYDQLHSLVEAGEVDAPRADDGEALYRRCGAEHHHHVVGRRCGRSIEVEGPEVERWARRVAAEHGFTDLTHTVEVFGVCAACAGKR